MEVYLVVVLLKPVKKQAEEGATPQIVVQPTAVMAKDSSQASLAAARLIPAEHAALTADRFEVRVMPFRSSGC